MVIGQEQPNDSGRKSPRPHCSTASHQAVHVRLEKVEDIVAILGLKIPDQNVSRRCMFPARFPTQPSHPTIQRTAIRRSGVKIQTLQPEPHRILRNTRRNPPMQHNALRLGWRVRYPRRDSNSKLLTSILGSPGEKVAILVVWAIVRITSRTVI